jgi:hypothetical protein
MDVSILSSCLARTSMSKYSNQLLTVLSCQVCQPASHSNPGNYSAINVLWDSALQYLPQGHPWKRIKPELPRRAGACALP